jgi:hypothetical protein
MSDDKKPERARDKGQDGYRGDWLKRGEGPLAYSPKGLCRAAGISLTLLYDAWSKGIGPPFARLNSRRIISHADAVAWLEQLKAATTPESERLRAEQSVPVATRAGKASGAKRKAA